LKLICQPYTVVAIIIAGQCCCKFQPILHHINHYLTKRIKVIIPEDYVSG
jgi:hypothetical protein